MRGQAVFDCRLPIGLPIVDCQLPMEDSLLLLLLVSFRLDIPSAGITIDIRAVFDTGFMANSTEPLTNCAASPLLDSPRPQSVKGERQSVETTPPYLRALGRRELPASIDVLGERFQRGRVFKNDFFAVTAMYANEHRKVVLKVGRQAWLGIFPMRWVGRLLAAKERAALQALSGTEGIPRYLCHWEDTGIVREYLDGHAMIKGERVPDDFHERLRGLIRRVHAAGMAYVDLEKCENVLVGADGRPGLFDFQIAWHWPRGWGGELFPARLIRRWLQRADWYHLVKLQRRTRPDQLSREELAQSYVKPGYVQAYTRLSRPLTLFRRWLLRRIDPRRIVD